MCAACDYIAGPRIWTHWPTTQGEGLPVKYLHFIWSNLTRNRARLTFTLISIVSAFALYGMLAAISVFFQGGNRFSTDDRIFITSKFPGPMPYSHVEKISTVPGIVGGRASYGVGLGGFYQDPTHPVGPVAMNKEFASGVDPTGRFVFNAEQLQQYHADPAGALVHESLAKEFGWKVGDVIPVTVPYLERTDGTRVWNLNVRGLYRYKDPAENARQIIMHYEYFDAGRVTDRGTVGFIAALIDKGADPARVAGAVDELFMNSAHETRSGTQDGLRREYFQRIGNISLIAYLILGAVFLSMLLVTGNSLMQSFAERTREIGILKALGFEPSRIWGLVLFESTLMMCVGGALGLTIAWLLVSVASRQMNDMRISSAQLAVGLAMMLATGVVTGLVPAMRARRLSIVEAFGTARR